MPAIRQPKGKDARKNDPGAVKKRPNGFILYKLDAHNRAIFLQDKREYLNIHKDSGEDAKTLTKESFGHASKCLAERWRSESVEVRRRFMDMSKEKQSVQTSVPHTMEEEEEEVIPGGRHEEDHSHCLTDTWGATPSGSQQGSLQVVQMPQAIKQNSVTASTPSMSVSNMSYMTRGFSPAREYPTLTIRPSIRVDTRVSPYDYCSSSQGDWATYATRDQTPRFGPPSVDAAENGMQFRPDPLQGLIDELHQQPWLSALDDSQPIHHSNQNDELYHQQYAQNVDAQAYFGPVLENFTQELDHYASVTHLPEDFSSFQLPGTQPMNPFALNGESSSTAAGWDHHPSLELTFESGLDEVFQRISSPNFDKRDDWLYSPLNESATDSPQEELDINSFRWGGGGSNEQFWTYF